MFRSASRIPFLLAAFIGPAALASFPTLALKPVCKDQLHAITTITNAGDGSGRLFVTEQYGRVRVFRDGMLLPTPFLTIDAAKLSPTFTSSISYEERGLLGLAFHPDYENASQPGYGKFYVYYTAPSDIPAGTDPVLGTTDPVSCMAVVAEYQVSGTDANVANAASERVLLKFNKPQSNHNGGQLEFGPDGFLYIGVGDGGDGNDNSAGHTGGRNSPRPTNNLGNSQDKTRLLGKILRIDPLGTNGPGGTYGIPGTNPFVGAGSGVREEIYAYGLRNPWRFSFDAGAVGSPRLFCADVGQSALEEVNLITSGGNYGWHVREGTDAFFSGAPVNGTSPIDPVAQYAHPFVTAGTPTAPQYGTAVVGGIVYRGTAIPALEGKYVFGDYWAGSGIPGVMLGLEETAPSSGAFTLSQLTLDSGGPITGKLYCFGQNESGDIYVGTTTRTGPLQTDISTGKPAASLSKLVLPADLTLTHRDVWFRQYFAIGAYLDPKGDEDLDGIPNDVEYAYGYSPLAANDPKTGLSVSATFANDGAADLAMVFRRDALATDLTYKLQTSADMDTWNTITTSVAGAAATGAGATESTITGQLKLVSVNYHSPATAPQQRFVRLLIERAP